MYFVCSILSIFIMRLFHCKKLKNKLLFGVTQKYQTTGEHRICVEPGKARAWQKDRHMDGKADVQTDKYIRSFMHRSQRI